MTVSDRRAASARLARVIIPVQTSAAEPTDPTRARDRRDADAIARAYAPASLSRYTFKERLLIRAADLVFSLLIRLLGASARFSVEGWRRGG